MRTQKQKVKQQTGILSLSQQLTAGKRNRVQNRKYEDYAMSVSKHNTDSQQSIGNKYQTISTSDAVSSARYAKTTLLNELLHEDSADTDESSSNVYFDEYYKLISHTEKKTNKEEQHGKLESKHNSSQYKISNGSPKKNDLQKQLQEALATIANLENKIEIIENAQTNATPNRHIMDVTTPPKISTEITTLSSTRNNTIENVSQQSLEISDDSSNEIRSIVPNNQHSKMNKRNRKNVREELQPQNLCSEEDIQQIEQLYGKDWSDDTMVMLRDEIYCRRSVLCEALGASSKASHLVRRLLLGVFKKDAICHATLTGKTPRNTNHKQNAEQLHALDLKAKSAIIKYSQSVAKNKGWNKQSTKLFLLVMSQRIGEIKRDNNKAARNQLNLT